MNILSHICFKSFLKCKNSKESQTQSMLKSSKQSWLKLQLQLYKRSSRMNYIYLNRTTCPTLYQGIQCSLPCTTGYFLMGAKLFIGTPKVQNKVVLKINWYGLCENTWFPWQPVIRFSIIRVDL